MLQVLWRCICIDLSSEYRCTALTFSPNDMQLVLGLTSYTASADLVTIISQDILPLIIELLSRKTLADKSMQSHYVGREEGYVLL